jgi:hypothetical protein
MISGGSPLAPLSPCRCHACLSGHGEIYHLQAAAAMQMGIPVHIEIQLACECNLSNEMVSDMRSLPITPIPALSPPFVSVYTQLRERLLKLLEGLCPVFRLGPVHLPHSDGDLAQHVVSCAVTEIGDKGCEVRPAAGGPCVLTCSLTWLSSYRRPPPCPSGEPPSSSTCTSSSSRAPAASSTPSTSPLT